MWPSVLFVITERSCYAEVMAEAGHAPAETSDAAGSKYKQIMGIRAVHFLACWALIYVGVEVTLGGQSFTEL